VGWPGRVAATLAVLAVVVGFVLLGRWQWSVATAGSDRSASVDAGKLTAPRPLDEVVALEEYVPLEAIGSRVSVTGRLMTEDLVLVRSRDATGEVSDPDACWRVMPLVLESGAAVPVVVGAGSCSLSSDDVPTLGSRPDIRCDGSCTITGVLQPSDPPRALEQPAGPQFLPAVTTDVLVRRWPYQLHDGYVVVDGIRPLRAAPPAVGIDLQNAAYALQWWFFACFALVVWWRAVRPQDLPEDLPPPDTVSQDRHEGERTS
jgi:surfeit locus 1 family protein